MVRLSIPGCECVHCGAIVGEPLACPGCGHVDPLTREPDWPASWPDPDHMTGPNMKDVG